VPFMAEKSFFLSPGIEPRFLDCKFRTLVIIPTVLRVEFLSIGRVVGNCESSHCVLGSCFPFTSRDRLVWTYPCNKRPNSQQQSLKIIRNRWLNPISFMSRAGLLVYARPVNLCSRNLLGELAWSHQMTHFQERLKGAVVNDYKCHPIFKSPQISLVVHPLIREVSEWRDIIVPDCCIAVLVRVPSLCAFYIASRENS
jgi:hypothetical protein